MREKSSRELALLRGGSRITFVVHQNQAVRIEHAKGVIGSIVA